MCDYTVIRCDTCDGQGVQDHDIMGADPEQPLTTSFPCVDCDGYGVTYVYQHHEETI